MESLIRRREMGRKLPYDYEVEYVESTGTQYIDCDAKLLSTNNSSLIQELDIYMNLTVNNTRQLMGSNGRWYMGLDGSKQEIRNMYFGYKTDQDYHRYRLIAQYPNVTGYVDNSQGQTVSDNGYNNKYYNIFLFVLGYREDSPSYYYWCKGKIKWAKIKINNVTIRDFIPVVKDNIGYMYDKVSGQLFGNAGTGQFIVGPRINSAAVITQQQQHEMYG